ncbi:MAG: hypothetical protein KA184_15105 [Candidatus Hydrogenedentes bacterium]|nr:hypothetical protein [Candidatus Hydrogenedentota bacterium]
MTRMLKFVLIALLVATAAGPAAAWSPRTQLSLVDFALNLLAAERNLPLKQRQREIREGAMIPQDQLAAEHPGLETDPVRAIEAEVYLLQVTGSNGFDTYYAYRLGVLGKMIAGAVSPLRTAPAMFRERYETDVEAAIDRLAIQTGKRVLVESRSYFTDMVARAAGRDEMILKDYQDGLGFEGVAKASLPSDAGRTVDAIADAWLTLLTSDTVVATVSDSQLHRYVLGGYAFYIGRGNLPEIEGAADRLAKIAPPTPDMRVTIGDLFYEAGFRERAMQEYQAVLAAQPDRREVTEKIGAYYVEQGDALLEDGQLEKALAAYTTAIDTDALHPTAEGKRLDTEKLIQERDQRRDEQLNALNTAAGLEAQADQHALNGYYAAAIAQLLEANRAYETITPEFSDAYAKASRGLRDNVNRIQELRQGLMANAEQLSGSGFALDARALAATRAKDLDQQALRALADNALQSAFTELESDMREALKPK